MKVISNVQKKTGLIFLILGLLSLCFYFIIILPNQNSSDDIKAFIMITIALLGFGFSFIFI